MTETCPKCGGRVVAVPDGMTAGAGELPSLQSSRGRCDACKTTFLVGAEGLEPLEP